MRLLLELKGFLSLLHTAEGAAALSVRHQLEDRVDGPADGRACLMEAPGVLDHLPCDCLDFFLRIALRHQPIHLVLRLRWHLVAEAGQIAEVIVHHLDKGDQLVRAHPRHGRVPGIGSKWVRLPLGSVQELPGLYDRLELSAVGAVRALVQRDRVPPAAEVRVVDRSCRVGCIDNVVRASLRFDRRGD